MKNIKLYKNNKIMIYFKKITRKIIKNIKDKSEIKYKKFKTSIFLKCYLNTRNY